MPARPRASIRSTPAASFALAWSHAMAKQYEQAQIHLQLAYELNENDPWTLMSSAMCFALCGETERARELADHALKLPLAPSPLQWAYHAAIRFMAGDYEGCVERSAGWQAMPAYVPGYKAAALFHLGDRASAASASCSASSGLYSGDAGSERSPQTTRTSRAGSFTYSRSGGRRTGSACGTDWPEPALRRRVTHDGGSEPAQPHSADRVVPDPAGLQLYPLVWVWAHSEQHRRHRRSTAGWDTWRPEP